MTDRKLIAFDVDGTLTAYHGRLEEENRALLLRLSKKYRVLIVGAGDCARIFAQLGGLPLDILGNYGMEYAHGSEILRSDRVATDRAALLSAAEKLRARTGLTDFCGDSLFFHKTGLVTLPLPGTAADPAARLSADPTGEKRAALYPEVAAAFPGYSVFICGSSSFDVVPQPYDKFHALSRYCESRNIPLRAVLFCGDDYGAHGNDEPVLSAGVDFLRVDDPRALPGLLARL